MKNITLKKGMTMEILVKEINARLEEIRTMHNMNNENIILIDHNFKMVFKEFEKLSRELSGKIDNDVVNRLIELQKSFNKIQTDINKTNSTK